MGEFSLWIKKKQMYLFPVLDILLNGVNYFYHIYMSWFLMQSEYGIFNALLAVLAMLMVSGISLQTFVANKGASQVEEMDVIRYRAMLVAGVYIATIGILIWIFKAWILVFTRGQGTDLMILLAIFSLNALLSIQRGVLQGKRKFTHLNGSFYSEVLSKLILLMLLLPSYPYLGTGLLSICFGMFISLIHSLWCEPIKLTVSQAVWGQFLNNRQCWKEQFTSLGTIFASNFSLYFFTSVDMLIVNFYMPEVSGNYAVIMRYSQLVLFAGMSCLTVFLPYLSKVSAQMNLLRRQLRVQLSILAGGSIIAIGGYLLVLPLTVTLFFGQQYTEAANLLVYGAIVYIALLFSYHMTNVLVVMGEKNYVLDLLGICILQIVVLTFNQQSLQSLLLSEGAVFLLLFVRLLMRVKKLLESHNKESIGRPFSEIN